MARIRLTNPTGRNTRAHVVSIGPHDFYFSYETCIAYAGPKVRCRVPNLWGPTTSRHFREMRCYGWTEVPFDDFENALSNYGDPLVNWESAMIALVGTYSKKAA